MKTLLVLSAAAMMMATSCQKTQMPAPANESVQANVYHPLNNSRMLDTNNLGPTPEFMPPSKPIYVNFRP